MKTDSAQIQYDKMTKTPVNKLVLQLGLPTTVSMLVTSVYNMADTFFVSQLGTSVSGATGVVFALMAIINAFGFMWRPHLHPWLSLPRSLHASPWKH